MAPRAKAKAGRRARGERDLVLFLVEVPFEHREEELGTHGLLDIVLEPKLLRLLDHATRARHHDHRQRRERLVAQLLRAEPPAVLHGHHQVEKDDTGGNPPAKLIEGDLPVLGNRHLVTLYLKPAGYGVTAVAIILDDLRQQGSQSQTASVLTTASGVPSRSDAGSAENDAHPVRGTVVGERDRRAARE